jgi:hypothetical protein
MKMAFDKKYGALYLKYTMKGRYFGVTNKKSAGKPLMPTLHVPPVKMNGCRRTVLNRGQLAPVTENGRSGN